MNASTPPSDDALNELAAEWLYEREDGFSSERALAFADWCKSDPRHCEAVKRVEAALALLDELPAIREPLEESLPVRRPRSVRPFPSWLARSAGLAAVLCLAVAIGWSLKRANAPGVEYAADTSAQRTLSLSDGSIVDLNTSSTIWVGFIGGERRIILKKGEANFQVVHDPGRPFIVTAGAVSVRAVGTVFDVKLAPQGVSVVVVEGKVELARSGSGASGSDPISALLQADELAELPEGNLHKVPKIARIGPAAVRAAVTWKNSKTSFSNVPLRDVVTRFNRRNPTQLVLESAQIGDLKIGGTFSTADTDGFVRLLEQDGGVVADRTIAGRITLRRPR